MDPLVFDVLFESLNLHSVLQSKTVGMTAIGIKAEAVQHHPEWFNVWNTVDVAWTTHDVCAGLSQRDIDMATFCDATTVQVGN